MKSTDIRKKFFDFFISRGHEQVPSSSLIPAQDPTLLFANAGMNQFKDVFLGTETRTYTKAVSIQKCVRAGGKHNDLDNVGFTKRHLTFFEMMGNFSFGDYFKKEAIQYAWDFLTKELKLPTQQLHASVYHDDEESYQLWHQLIGLPQEKIHRLGAQDNFWQMGDTGPCGPCTEIHIDRGPGFGCESPCSPACDCDRFLEIWNLVFMQYDRQADGTDKPLKKTGVDTGMGLERLCAVVQNVDSVYHTDLFMPIIAQTEVLVGKKYADQDTLTQAAFHVLADHIRSSTLLIADGCAPSNEGRGYVLRKIIRRAALFAQKITDKNIFPLLSRVVVDQMKGIYPELATHAPRIEKVLASEIEKFATNLIRGRALLETYFAEHKATHQVSGEQAFKLYDTYGFPSELIVLMAREHGFTVDLAGFEAHMLKQREQSGKKTQDALATLELPDNLHSEFTGYHELTTPSEISALVHNGAIVSHVAAGESCYVITKKSPFFIVGGGQVPDQGWLMINGHRAPLTEVRYIQQAIAAQIVAPVDLRMGMPITSEVDALWRTNAMKNHTATHLLQAALMQLFGNHIKQSGSLVHPDYLRFDFTYHANLSSQDIVRVERLVNEKIMENIPVTITYTSMKEAVKQGALAFFGDKYNPDNVRMVCVPHFSTELCGGTHVPATGAIGVFKITEVSALSAGLRRIVAVTGPRAVELFQESFGTVKTLSQEFKVKLNEVCAAVAKQRHELETAQQQSKMFKKQIIGTSLASWTQQIDTTQPLPLLVLQLTDFSAGELREISNQLQQASPGLHVIASIYEGKNSFVCSLHPSMTAKMNLKEFGAWLQTTHGIKSGGNAQMLQGGLSQSDIKAFGHDIKQWLAHAIKK